MLLDLFVLKFKNLNTVGQCGLCRLCLVEEVNDLSIWKSLLDVFIAEINYGVAIRKSLTSNAVIKNNLFFSIKINSLNLTISVFDFVFDCDIFVVIIVIHDFHLDIKLFPYWSKVLLFSFSVFRINEFRELHFRLISVTFGWAFFSNLFFNLFKILRCRLQSR